MILVDQIDPEAVPSCNWFSSLDSQQEFYVANEGHVVSSSEIE